MAAKVTAICLLWGFVGMILYTVMQNLQDVAVALFTMLFFVGVSVIFTIAIVDL